MRKKPLLRVLSCIRFKPVFFISLVALGLLPFMLNYIFATFFVKMIAALETSNWSALRGDLVQAVIIWLGVSLSGGLAKFLFDYAVNHTTADFRSQVFAKIQRLPQSFLEERHSGDLISRVTNDLKALETVYKTNLRLIVRSILGGASALIVMLGQNTGLAVVTVSMGLVFTVVNSRFVKSVRQISDQVQNELGKLTTRLKDILAGVQVSRIFGLETKLNQDYAQENRKVYSLTQKRVRLNAMQNSVNFFSGFMSFVGLIIIGGLFVLKEQASFGDIIFVIQMQNDVNWMIRNLGDQLTQMQSGLAGAKRVLELIDFPEEPQQWDKANHTNGISISSRPIHGSSATSHEQRERFAVEMQEVTFHYLNGGPVLKDLSFQVSEGHIFALVGPSGGGKSTIFKLILGLYPPVAGEIFVDGRSVYDMTLAELRSMIAYVPQDSYLFSGTIGENIAYGNVYATQPEIETAAKAAFAHDFITRLPHGYNTRVGERGTHLSGGERQRIAIARAILKNAPILMLDEATSALDSESEQLVQKALEHLMVGKTTLVIAHRLSTVEKADQILVIDQGKVVEAGTHDRLLSNPDSLYTHLYKLQYAGKQGLAG